MEGTNWIATFVRVGAISAVVAVGGHRISASTERQQAQPGIDVLVTRIGDRVAEFYHRAQSVMCLERSTTQPIRPNWSLDGLARTVESDLRVELRAAEGVPDLVREIRKINGRPPRERDAKSRNACTDPNPLSPEPLAFLLPSHRDEYLFTSVRNGSERDRAALIISFQTVNRSGPVQLIEDEGGHEDCFDWKGPIARKGRVWVDAETDEVLRSNRISLVLWTSKCRVPFNADTISARSSSSSATIRRCGTARFDSAIRMN